jgi:hypothetical protein
MTHYQDPEMISESNDFTLLNIPVPEIVHILPPENKKEIYQYLNQLNEDDKKAYLIAFHHLGSSFNIYKSNGFKEWKQKKL